MQWISEAEQLPEVGQEVLLLVPRPNEKYADVRVMRILVSHQAVFPMPVQPGSKPPADFHWRGAGTGNDSLIRVTGYNFWASLTSMRLPDGFKHNSGRGFDWIEKEEPSDG
ncbi:MAG: hypothetical protein AAF225_10285 [Pseudomonadota bacterium]